MIAVVASPALTAKRMQLCSAKRIRNAPKFHSHFDSTRFRLQWKILFFILIRKGISEVCLKTFSDTRMSNSPPPPPPTNHNSRERKKVFKSLLDFFFYWTKLQFFKNRGSYFFANFLPFYTVFAKRMTKHRTKGFSKIGVFVQ